MRDETSHNMREVFSFRKCRGEAHTVGCMPFVEKGARQIQFRARTFDVLIVIAQFVILNRDFWITNAICIISAHLCLCLYCRYG